MRSEIKIHHTTVQTRIPAHEQAARRERAALSNNRQRAPQPPKPATVPRHQWIWGWGSRYQ